MEVIAVQKFKSDAPPMTIEVEDGDCPFCEAANQLGQFSEVGEHLYLVIDDKISEVVCIEITDEFIAFQCTQVSEREADRRIAEGLMNA